jgi:hypothetical protein
MAYGLKAYMCFGWNTAKSKSDYSWGSLSEKVGFQITVGDIGFFVFFFNLIILLRVCLNSISKAELIECFKNHSLQHMCQ